MTPVLWTSEDAAVVTGGVNSAKWQAKNLSIDTRSLQPGDLFVALKAARDGHDFVGAAFTAGAAGALVSRPVAGGPFLQVGDVLGALENLAIAARARSGAVRTAVTGSVGKTSVKEMLAKIYRAYGTAHWPEKSFNNHWGVPLTLARMPEKTARAVFEIGMSTPGEIAPRSLMVRPHCAIVTKIAGVHLEGVGSLDGIAKEKSDIFAGLEAAGAAIVPGEDNYVEYLARRAKAAASGVDVLTFGTGHDCAARVLDYVPKGHGAEAELDIQGTRVRVHLSAGGVHWALNAAAALLASVAVAGLSAKASAEALAGFAPPPGRGQVEPLHLPDGGTAMMVDDSYNANPTSMGAALTALTRRPAGRRLVALGEMGELGPDAPRFHADLAETVDASGAEVAWLSGVGMKALYTALPAGGTTQKHWAVKADDLLESVKNTLRDGDTLLIKGSNASGMVKFADALRQWSAKSDEQVMGTSQKGGE